MKRWDCTEILTLYDKLRSVMEDGDAREWLSTPHPELHRAPCELIEHPRGYQAVCHAVQAATEEDPDL